MPRPRPLNQMSYTAYFVPSSSMKKAFHKATSFLMAFVVLFSTMSFTVNSHYCGDNLVDVSVFSKLKTCGMESEKQSDLGLQSSSCSITDKSCCSDETKILKGQDELKLNINKIAFEQQVFVAVINKTYVNLFPSVKDAKPSLKAYPPPLIFQQLFKLDETYLI